MSGSLSTVHCHLHLLPIRRGVPPPRHRGQLSRVERGRGARQTHGPRHRGEGEGGEQREDRHVVVSGVEVEAGVVEDARDSPHVHHRVCGVVVPH